MSATSIEQALSAATHALENFTDQAQLEAQILLAFTLEKNRTWLYTWPEKSLKDNQREKFNALLKQRQLGTPVAYLTGEKEFWSLPLYVNKDVLIPRPETEELVSKALELLPEEDILIADLGTGSGAIALALASERPAWKITATDQSEPALTVARENTDRLKLQNRIEFLQGSWCQPLTSKQNAIISNPPYIANQDPHLSQPELQHEPQTALASGPDGLKDIRDIADQARAFLLPDGLLLLEHGYDQQPAVIKLLTQLGYHDVGGYPDLQNLPRLVSARFNH